MITISFQTKYLPPPFSHAYVIRIKEKGKVLHYEFDLEYLDRDGMSTEEMIHEGAEPESFISFKGNFNTSWSDILKKEIEKVSLKDEQDAHKDYLFFELENGKSGYPRDFDTWSYLLQEMIQAIYELNEKELPLNILIHLVHENKEILSLQASFAKRTTKVNGKEKPWSFLKESLAFLENCELSEGPVSKMNNPGAYIDYGDGLPFRIVGLKNTKNSSEIIALLKDKFV